MMKQNPESRRPGRRLARRAISVGCAAALVVALFGGCTEETTPAPAASTPTPGESAIAAEAPTTAPVPAKADDTLDDRGLPPGYAFDSQREITPRDTKKLIDEQADFVLIDCRTPEEVAAGKIEGSIHLPLQQLEKREAELAQWKGKKIVVYCRSGNRSGKFVDALQAKGFSDAKSMAGGIVLWNRGVMAE